MAYLSTCNIHMLTCNTIMIENNTIMLIYSINWSIYEIIIVYVNMQHNIIFTWDLFMSACNIVMFTCDLFVSSPRTHGTHTYCWEFDSGAVTTCFNDWGLSRLGFEHPTFRLRGERSNPLRHRRGSIFVVIEIGQLSLLSDLIQVYFYKNTQECKKYNYIN